MTISELIKALQRLEEENGDISVETEDGIEVSATGIVTDDAGNVIAVQIQ